ncbi:MAG: TIGR03915 family putative DNA repair protein [Atopobiaceae bacterium]|nr:TIGR03915 family putative DNA repair protein [Atopobiaceae bacterium]
MGQPVVLACDPSLEGVLAAVGIGYLAHAHAGQMRLASKHALQPQLGETALYAPSAQEDDTVAFARRVLVGFAAKVARGCKRQKSGSCSAGCDAACVSRLVLACASDDTSMPQTVAEYLRLGFSVGPRVRTMIANPQVAAFNELARSVLAECEHTRQFVRFSHMADGSFAASFSAKADTVPLTAAHFAARMSTERFCLVDPRHQVAAFHDPSQKGCQIVRLDAALANNLANRQDFADDEHYVRAMWQRFYHRTTTPGRDKSQRGYDLRTSWMPQRFWDKLTELEPAHDGMVSVPARYGA